MELGLRLFLLPRAWNRLPQCGMQGVDIDLPQGLLARMQDSLGFISEVLDIVKSTPTSLPDPASRGEGEQHLI